ncbi:MAG: hypothetical protein KAQ92_03650 [Candidatus Aenigmarchaeota archaeon]|nr:hypothetical protein [Candidatus Aenigmarchaeota archaeon]
MWLKNKTDYLKTDRRNYLIMWLKNRTDCLKIDSLSLEFILIIFSL